MMMIVGIEICFSIDFEGWLSPVPLMQCSSEQHQLVWWQVGYTEKLNSFKFKNMAILQ